MIGAEENFVEHAAAIPRAIASMTVHETPSLVVIDSGLASDTFNVICRARRPSDAEVDDAIAQFGDRPFSWWVFDETFVPPLRMKNEEIVMTASLDAIQIDPVPAELRIERVTTREQLRDFAWVNDATDFFDMAPMIPSGFFVGYAGDEAVTTSQVTFAAGVAGIYYVATLARHRRHGYGSAMFAHALLAARHAGFATAVLEASEDGAGIYERAGFRAVGRVREYGP